MVFGNFSYLNSGNRTYNINMNDGMFNNNCCGDQSWFTNGMIGQMLGGFGNILPGACGYGYGCGGDYYAQQAGANVMNAMLMVLDAGITKAVSNKNAAPTAETYKADISGLNSKINTKLKSIGLANEAEVKTANLSDIQTNDKTIKNANTKMATYNGLMSLKEYRISELESIINDSANSAEEKSKAGTELKTLIEEKEELQLKLDEQTDIKLKREKEIVATLNEIKELIAERNQTREAQNDMVLDNVDKGRARRSSDEHVNELFSNESLKSDANVTPRDVRAVITAYSVAKTPDEKQKQANRFKQLYEDLSSSDAKQFKSAYDIIAKDFENK